MLPYQQVQVIQDLYWREAGCGEALRKSLPFAASVLGCAGHGEALRAAACTPQYTLLCTQHPQSMLVPGVPGVLCVDISSLRLPNQEGGVAAYGGAAAGAKKKFF
eukprot:2624028-Rhodomonas_salina.1